MTVTAPDAAASRRSTGELREFESLGHRREAGGRTILRLEAETSLRHPLQAMSVGWRRPDLVIVWGATGGHRLPQTFEHVAEGYGHAVVDSRVKSQCGREAAVLNGEAIVRLYSRRLWITFLAQSRYVNIGLLRKLLVPLVPHFEVVLKGSISQDNEALRLLRTYVNALGEAPVPATPELRRLIVVHIQDLVALMIGAAGHAAAIGQHCSLRAARLQAIKADIAAHLREQEFTVGAVAAHQHVSARYVQMLFESEGTTFSHFVLGQRLALAKRMLADRRYVGWTISAIAMETGFGDISHFDHAFRRFYATSPSEVRAAVYR